MVKDHFKTLENVLMFETAFMYEYENTLSNFEHFERFEPCIWSIINLGKDSKYKLKDDTFNLGLILYPWPCFFFESTLSFISILSLVNNQTLLPHSQGNH